MISNLTIFHKNDTDPKLLSPLNLALIGDTVFDLMVRERLLGQGNRPVGKLHKMCAEIVCAGAQAKAVGKILPLLSDEEEAIFKRGRNADAGHKPKNAELADYKAATGFEALLGWLYLSKQFDRLEEIFNSAVDL